MAGLGSLLGPVGMGASVAGQIFGAIKGAKAAKEQQTQLDKQQQENKSMFDNTANKDFLDTAAGKGAMKLNNENLLDAQKNIAGRSAITGASDEAAVAGQTGLNRNYNDAVSRLASMGTQYQQRAQDRYMAHKNVLDQRQSDLTAQKAESAAALVGNAGNLMTSSASMIDDKKQGAAAQI
jgi:uncharacterized membrane-anchored protein YhcB (DUF1043 family)